MNYSLHIPSKKDFDKFKSLIKEGQRLTGMTTFRFIAKAVIDLVIKERKEALK